MENLDAERYRKVEGQSLANRPEANGQIKETIDASSLAEALLQFGFAPASQEQLQEFSKQYLDELLFLNLFSVDYVLGRMSVAQSSFTSVRKHYYQGIESYCVDEGFGYLTIIERFEIYARACNAYFDYDQEKRERLGPYWELGKAFSKFASDDDPWIPNAIEVETHCNYFASACLRLSILLAQYEVV
jgi:hypothetical protein